MTNRSDDFRGGSKQICPEAVNRVMNWLFDYDMKFLRSGREILSVANGACHPLFESPVKRLDYCSYPWIKILLENYCRIGI